MGYRVGQKVRIIRNVQRAAGAVWVGDEATINAVTGDSGYRIRTTNGVFLDRVPDNAIEKI